MFNQGAAAGAVGGLGKAMMKAGSDLRQSRGQVQAANNGMGVGSPRKYRKILQASVDAHRQFSEIDTEHHGQRLNQQTESALKLGEAGFHTIRQTTPFGTTEAQKDPGATAGGIDQSYNPSHDVHGHPGAGHVVVHGYSGDAAPTPGAHQTNNVYTMPTTAVKSSRVQPLSLESGKATDMGTQAGPRPGASAPAGPGFKASGADVIKIGSFMDKPSKAQPEIPSKVAKDGAIPMGSSATKGKMKGPQLMKSPDTGKLTEAGWDAKLSAQEGAELAKRGAKMKKDNY